MGLILGIHPSWWETSERIIGGEGCLDVEADTKTIGVTPAILHKETSLEVLQVLRKKYFGENFLKLFEGELWTEYCLYRIIGCMRGKARATMLVITY